MSKEVIDSRPLASIVVPVYNGMGRVEALVELLAEQVCEFEWDLMFVDSGSKDETVRWLEARADTFPMPLRVASLGADEFDHGDTRNFGTALTRGEVLVFLTDDARPIGTGWLQTVVGAVVSTRASAVYCRNLAPVDASAWAATLVSSDGVYAEQAPELSQLPAEAHGPQELREAALYCDTASAILRTALDLHPYPRADAGEDMLLARGLRESGFGVQMLGSAPVEHIHFYTPEQMRQRALLDGRFNKEAFGREITAPYGSAATPELVAQMWASSEGTLRGHLHDPENLAEQRERLLELYRAFVEGAQAGQSSARGRRWPTSALKSPEVRVAVIHNAEQAESADAFCKSLGSLGIQAATIELDSHSRLTGTEHGSNFDLAHILLESWPDLSPDDAWLASLPCIMGTLKGWKKHLFGYQVTSHGAHDRAELHLPAIPHPCLEDAQSASARWAFRYRQLLCMVHSQGAYQRWGFEADSIRGDVRREGEVLMTMGPGPAQLGFDIPPLGSAVTELLLDVESLDLDLGEDRCVIAYLDGREIGLAGHIPTLSAPAISRHRLALELPPEGGRLTLENLTPAGLRTVCRVRSIALQRGERESVDERLFVASTPVDETLFNPADVAVVIVTLQGARRLKSCLASLFASSSLVPEMQVLVVDNGDSKGTQGWLDREYPGVQRVSPGGNIGFTQAANWGASHCKDAKVLVFLNDDAEVAEGFIENLVSPLNAGRCSAAAARMLLPDGSQEYGGGAGSFQGFAFGGPEDPLHHAELDRPRRTLFACGGAMAILGEAFREVGGFDADYFAYYDDIDLGWRLWIYGYEVHYVPKAVCTHARSSTSSSFPAPAVRLLQVRNALCTCIKNLGDEALRATLPALLALSSRRLWIQARRPSYSSLRIERIKPRRLKLQRPYLLPPMAMADLLGFQDVLGDWDKWMAKREKVQSMRRRLDVEILPLFIDPLRCVEGEQEYVALQDSLTELFRLKQIFRTDTSSKP